MCFTSAFSFFQTICDIVNLVTYSTLSKNVLICKLYISALSLLNNMLFILLTFCFGIKLVLILI